MKTIRVLSALLSYPTPELTAAGEEFKAALASENVLSADVRRELESLIDDIAARDLYELQERYVLLFDRTRSLSLHLFVDVGAIRLDSVTVANAMPMRLLLCFC